VAGTAQKWGGEGKNYTFLAESPQAMEEAREIGAPKVMKGYRDEDVPQPSPFGPGQYGPEPKAGELDEMKKFKSFWGTHVNEHYKGRDPLTVNPAEEGIKAEDAARRKYAISLMAHDPKSVDYKKYEKLITDERNDAIKKAEWQRRIGEEDHRMSLDFFRQATAKEAKEQKNVQTRSNVQAAQKYTEEALYGPNSWQNYNLTQEDLAKMAKDKNYTPQSRRLKSRVLTDVNRVRELSGLPALLEKQIQIPTVEFNNWGLFRTGEKPGTPNTGYRYGEPVVVRTGVHNGRRVVQYEDGRVEYAK
jgi:hypothetical protein